MNTNNVVSLKDEANNATATRADIESEFYAEMNRAAAWADLLCLAGDRFDELKEGTISTTGEEILNSLKKAREKFDQLLHANTRASGDRTPAASVENGG